MDFTDLMNPAGEKKDAFSCRGFTGVYVGNNADISRPLERD
jgi:hypothetical protein